jgi:hypothetical protein
MVIYMFYNEIPEEEELELRSEAANDYGRKIAKINKRTAAVGRKIIYG